MHMSVTLTKRGTVLRAFSDSASQVIIFSLAGTKFPFFFLNLMVN